MMTRTSLEAGEAAEALATGQVKCVVWDLDGTLWDDVALESPSGELPTPRAWVLEAIDSLAARGVLSSVASRTAPSVLDLLRADAGLWQRFVAPQAGWHDKSHALRRIADELGIAVDSLVLVDDSPYERAEVAAMLPGVRTFAPEQVPALLLSGLGTSEVTEDARRRAERYRTEAARKEAGAQFQGTREEFLHSCRMRLSLGPAEEEDLARVAELAVRTHRLNSSGFSPDVPVLRVLTASGTHSLLVARLDDRFGEYGLVGAGLVEWTPKAGWVRLLALSCRTAGRGVSQAFLRRLMDRAVDAGAEEFRVDLRPTSANTELRILFRQVGLRVADDTGSRVQAAGPVTLHRPLSGDLPDYPPWLTVSGR